MKYLMLITVLAMTANVYAAPKAKKSKTIMHDKEHHHVKKKADIDHAHEAAHHKKHDHSKHHPNHEADMKKDGDKHKAHAAAEVAPVVEEVKN